MGVWFYLGGTSRGGGLLYFAFICKNGFLAQSSSAMVAASESLMLSSMAACVIAPLIITEELLFRGFKTSTGDARLKLLVFFARPLLVANVFLGSITGVDARLWLLIFRPAGSTGVDVALTLFFLSWLSLSVPQNCFFSSFCT